MENIFLLMAYIFGGCMLIGLLFVFFSAIMNPTDAEFNEGGNNKNGKTLL